ncbi:MAG TPA: hypothetical protein VK724_02805 [Bryobacteraceae bacterium]|nr:hypothetical protein [Bryobacteraceae bacterium]
MTHRFFAFWIALGTLATVAEAQTVIDSVIDAASYAPRVAPGALASIFGSNLADYTQGASGFPLPKSMAGATVYLNQSPVPLLFVSQTQINFQVPSGLAAGIASLYVSRDGGTSTAFQFTVVPNGPAMFQDSSNHAIAQNLVDYSLNSSSNPVASGAGLIVYLTGQGPVNNAVPDGTATPASPIATATATATATIGGVNATVQFLGLTPGFLGLAQANIVVPSLATADYPLVLTVGGYVSSSAMVSVSGSGSAPPTYLTQVGQLNFANGASSSLAIYGDTTYICGPNRINIIDTSDVAAPSYVGEFGDLQLAGNGGKCALNTAASEPILVDIVGPGDAPTFAVYSLENPDDPALLSQLTTSPYTFLTNISFLGTTGYVSTSWYQTSGTSITGQFGNFVAYDFSSLFPVLLGVLSSGPGSAGLSVMPDSLALAPSSSYPNTAYVTTTTATGDSTNGSAALEVVNISSPQSMQSIEQVTVSTAAIFLGFGYDDPLLLVTGNTNGFQNPGVLDSNGVLNFNINGNLTISTMNISNVDSPTGIANVTTQIPTSGTYVVQPFGSNIFAIVNNPPATDSAGPSSLWIVDATTPSTPVLYPFATEFGMSDVSAAFTSTASYLLVPNVNGLTIYSIQTP